VLPEDYTETDRGDPDEMSRMRTIGEALRRGAVFLRETGSPSARLDAEVLLGHCSGLRRVALYVQPERVLTSEEESSYRTLLERRARREPVSYLVGRKEFYGLTFQVDERVLIPRPETEVLVERALEHGKRKEETDLRVADIGTGSGCIAVALALHLPGARIYATDISSAALEVAKENCRTHDVSDRVILLQGDLCAILPEPVDLLVCNPPYTVWESLPSGISDYEPRIALDGGSDGLELYRRLFDQMPDYLCSKGYALLEFGDGQESAVIAMARELGPGIAIRIWRDYSGSKRVLSVGPYSSQGPS
jgi:release factor glutamine methyltransferase